MISLQFKTVVKYLLLKGYIIKATTERVHIIDKTNFPVIEITHNQLNRLIEEIPLSEEQQHFGYTYRLFSSIEKSVPVQTVGKASS